MRRKGKKHREFHFEIVPSDRQLQAIGTVCVQWALIENTVTMFVYGLTNENEETRQTFVTTHSFKKRLDQLQKLVSERVDPPWQAELMGLIVSVRNAQELRGRIVHGSWGDAENAETASPEAEGVFNWLKPQPRFQWKLTYGYIMKVARKIDDLHFRIWEFVRAASGEAKSSTISAALARISNILDTES